MKLNRSSISTLESREERTRLSGEKKQTQKQNKKTHTYLSTILLCIVMVSKKIQGCWLHSFVNSPGLKTVTTMGKNLFPLSP